MASSRREAAKKVAPPPLPRSVQIIVSASATAMFQQSSPSTTVAPVCTQGNLPIGCASPPGVARVGTVTEPPPDSNLSATLQPCGKRASSRPFYVSFSLSQTPGLGARSSGISDIIRTLSSHAPTLNRVASCLFRALGVSPRRHKCKKSAISSEFRSPGQRGCGTLSSH